MIRIRDSSLPIGARKLVSLIWIRIIESSMPSIGYVVISKVVILISGVIELLIGEVNLGMS